MDTLHNGAHCKIVLGAGGNTFCAIRSANLVNDHKYYNGAVPNENEHDLFQISWDINTLKVEHSSDYNTSTLTEILKLTAITQITIKKSGI